MSLEWEKRATVLEMRGVRVSNDMRFKLCDEFTDDDFSEYVEQHATISVQAWLRLEVMEERRVPLLKEDMYPKVCDEMTFDEFAEFIEKNATVEGEDLRLLEGIGEQELRAIETGEEDYES